MGNGLVRRVLVPPELQNCIDSKLYAHDVEVSEGTSFPFLRYSIVVGFPLQMQHVFHSPRRCSIYVSIHGQWSKQISPIRGMEWLVRELIELLRCFSSTWSTSTPTRNAWSFWTQSPPREARTTKELKFQWIGKQWSQELWDTSLFQSDQSFCAPMWYVCFARILCCTCTIIFYCEWVVSPVQKQRQ